MVYQEFSRLGELIDNVTVVDDQMRPPSTRMGVKNTKNNGVEFVVTLGVDGIL